MSAKINSLLRKFHSDEEGLEALQVVMIIAIAAVILVAAGTVGQSVIDFTKEKLTKLKDGRSRARCLLPQRQVARPAFARRGHLILFRPLILANYFPSPPVKP